MIHCLKSHLTIKVSLLAIINEYCVYERFPHALLPRREGKDGAESERARVCYGLLVNYGTWKENREIHAGCCSTSTYYHRFLLLLSVRSLVEIVCSVVCCLANLQFIEGDPHHDDGPFRFL